MDGSGIVSIEIITTRDGTRFAGYPNDHLFSLIKNGETFVDGYVKRAIDRYVNADSICVDVGANLGYVSIYLAARSKWVHSFEPQPVVFLQLCTNLFLNQCLNVKPYNMGCYSRETTLDFADYQSGWVGASDLSDYSKITSVGSVSFQPSVNGSVPAKPLDDVIAGKVDFIKIDAQGADIDVLFGAERILREHHPVVVWEYEEDLSKRNYGRSLDDLAHFLGELGYVSTEIYPGNYLLT